MPISNTEFSSHCFQFRKIKKINVERKAKKTERNSLINNLRDKN